MPGAIVTPDLHAAAVNLVDSQNATPSPGADLSRLSAEAAAHGLALVGQRELALLRLALCDGATRS